MFVDYTYKTLMKWQREDRPFREQVAESQRTLSRYLLSARRTLFVLLLMTACAAGLLFVAELGQVGMYLLAGLSITSLLAISSAQNFKRKLQALNYELEALDTKRTGKTHSLVRNSINKALQNILPPERYEDYFSSELLCQAIAASKVGPWTLRLIPEHTVTVPMEVVRTEGTIRVSNYGGNEAGNEGTIYGILEDGTRFLMREVSDYMRKDKYFDVPADKKKEIVIPTKVVVENV